MPRRVLAVSTVQALTLLGDSLLYVVLPLHAVALGLSGFQVGLLLSGNRFVRVLTNSVAARLMRRLPPGPPFVAATALASTTTALYALTPSFLPFLVARLLWGLCFSTLRLACFLTVLAEASDRTRGRLMGVYRSLSRLGSFTAVVVGGALFDAYGYGEAMLVMAAGTALALPIALWKGPTASAAGGGMKGETAAVTSSSTLIPPPASLKRLAVNWSAFTLAFVSRGVVTATLAVFLAGEFGERFGPDGAIGVATAAAWLIGASWLAQIALAAPLGALSDRVGRVRASVAWLLVSTAAMVALALAPAVGIAAAGAVTLFVAGAGLGSALDAAAGDLAPPERRAQVMSAYADWSDLGAAFGPLLALTFADAIGVRPSYALGAALLASGAAAIAAAFARRSQRSAMVA